MSIFHSHASVRGFSLIEVLVYIAVTVFVSTAGVLTYLSLNTVLLRQETERSVNHAAVVALEKISRDLRSASSVNTSQSTLGTSPSTLTLNVGTSTTGFSIVGGVLVYTRGGVEVGPLTGTAVTIENFTVDRYLGTSTELVRVALTLSAENKAASTTRTYYTSAVLRGSYE